MIFIFCKRNYFNKYLKWWDKNFIWVGYGNEDENKFVFQK